MINTSHNVLFAIFLQQTVTVVNAGAGRIYFLGIFMTKAWLKGLTVAIGLSGASHPVLADTSDYSVYNNASGDIYLKAPEKFILIHADVSIPLKVMPANGYVKLLLQPDGKWVLSIITAAEWNQLSLELSTAQIAVVDQRDLNGDGLADYSISLSSPQRVLSFLKQPTGVYTSLETEAIRPEISPSGGAYSSSIQVSLATTTPGAEIRYTTNGTDVTSSSQLYTGAFSLVASSTVKAKSFKTGTIDSATSSTNFVIQQNNQQVIYLHTDALGSVVLETDANGNVIKRTEYKPFGESIDN